jgi:hypothetical protein
MNARINKKQLIPTITYPMVERGSRRPSSAEAARLDRPVALLAVSLPSLCSSLIRPRLAVFTAYQWRP